MPSISPPYGPTTVAPTSTPRSTSSTTLMNPSLPGPWIQPRVFDEICWAPTRTVSPSSRACCSVSPTRPTSGSVKVAQASPW